MPGAAVVLQRRPGSHTDLLPTRICNSPHVTWKKPLRRLCRIKHCCFANILTAQANPDDYGIELLRRYHENLSEIFTDNQVLLRMIPHVKSIVPGEKEVREKEEGWA